MTILCRSYPWERKSYPWILFLIKIQLEMNFLRSDLSSSSTITGKIGDPVIMIHLLRLNQHRIWVHFWRKKWRFWSKLLPILSVDPSTYLSYCLFQGKTNFDTWPERGEFYGFYDGSCTTGRYMCIHIFRSCQSLVHVRLNIYAMVTLIIDLRFANVFVVTL